ncbi:stalk domain-containing protein [Paenibacillus sp.]|uniref:stalk domain-containing protein n=1 Tax=Paenibacillus sp. TaxID=58172 RepID=UPI002812193C|nr:stalk domain-containing protein [Paenibacillus sp.]
MRIRKTLFAAVAAALLASPSLQSAGAAEAVEPYVRSFGAVSLVKTDGTYWEWGGPKAVPTQIVGLTNVEEVFEGGWIVKEDGTVWIWEEESSGELRTEAVPEANELKETVQAYSHTLALDRSGNVFVRTSDENGNLGAPRPVDGIDDVVDIAFSSSQSVYLFVKSDGSVWVANSDLATVLPLSDVVGASAADDNVVLNADGTVWEVNRTDTVGWDSSLRLAANPIEGLRDIQSISAYREVRLAIDASSRLWFWGATRTGVSDGTIVHKQESPVALSAVADVKQAVHCERSIVVLTKDGSLYETSTSRESMPTDAVFRKLAEDVVSVTEGGRHVIFQKEDGSLWGWGVNKGATLGAGDEEFSHDTPVPVQKPIAVSLDGRTVRLANGVMLRGAQTFVPLRSVFESMGAQIVWDHPTKSVTIQQGDASPLTIVVEYETGTVLKNGSAVFMAEAPFISSGTSYLPLRFVSESLGAKVDWYADQYHIAITTAEE